MKSFISAIALGAVFGLVSSCIGWGLAVLRKSMPGRRGFRRATGGFAALLAVVLLIGGTRAWLSGEVDYDRGVTAMDGHNYTEAAARFGAAAERGYAPGECAFASLLYQGAGVEKDLSKAFQWALKAAKQDHARCQWFAGLMYGRGEGTEIDREEGMRLICAAARQNFAYARVTLDMMKDGNAEFPEPVLVELSAAGYEAGFKALGKTLEDLPVPEQCAMPQ